MKGLSCRRSPGQRRREFSCRTWGREENRQCWLLIIWPRGSIPFVNITNEVICQQAALLLIQSQGSEWQRTPPFRTLPQPMAVGQESAVRSFWESSTSVLRQRQGNAFSLCARCDWESGWPWPLQAGVNQLLDEAAPVGFEAGFHMCDISETAKLSAVALLHSLTSAFQLLQKRALHLRFFCKTRPCSFKCCRSQHSRSYCLERAF